MAVPLIPLYVAQLNPRSPLAGPTLAISFVLSGLFSPLWGKLATRYGTKPMLIRSSLMICLAYALSANATSVSGLFLSRCLAGVASGFVPIASSTLAQLSTPETRNRDLSWITSFRTGGTLAGPAIGAAIVWSTGSYRITFLASAGLSLFTLSAALISPNIKVQDRSISTQLQTRHTTKTAYWMPICAVFALTVSSMLLGTWLPLSLSSSSSAISAAPVLATITTASALITMTLAPFWGQLADRRKPGLILILTLILPIPIILGLLFSDNHLTVGFLIIAASAVGADTIGLLSAETTKKLAEQDIAPFFGWTNTATQYGNALGAGLAPIAMGMWTQLPIVLSVALDLLSVLIIFIFLKSGADGQYASRGE
ncbi:MFS transporter [Austwickia chelonae]|uniref:MFS transporter n=1 Tax=Austwickia chelonae TaxID=100225 RepID=UPI001F08646F|nr:MFS transporter [Austwickia chelonae]